MHLNIRIVLAGTVFLALVSCSKVDEQKKPPEVPVIAGKVVSKLIPTQINTYGTIEAYTSVPVKPQVGGQIVKIHISGGQEVKKGDLLYSIDKRPYEASMKQIEANMERDTVLAADAERQFRLKEELFQKKAVSEDEMFRTKAVAESLKRAVKVDEANLERSRLDIEYCSIKSPIDGRAGDILVDEGTVVKANDVTLIVINQIRPVTVTFSVPQFYLNQIKKHIAAKKLDIEVRAQNEEVNPVRANFEFLDNSVDPNTGTVRIEARVENDEEKFWPGQFVNVTINMLSENQILVVPSQAVQPSQKGNYVFVIKDDMTVEMRIVKILRSVANETGIAEGVNEGETVVLDGHLRLVPGSRVDIRKSVSEPVPAAPEKKAVQGKEAGK